eukprot:PITA_26962
MDVNTAFLNGDLKENVFMSQPKGFAVKVHEHKVCKIVKSLYGLKQAPRAWYEKLIEHLLKLNFKHYDLDDATLFVKKVGKIVVYIVVYLDDLLMIGNNESYIASIKKNLKKGFEMTDLGYAHYYLGIEVTQHPKSIFLSQKKYTGDLLNRFGMTKCNPLTTPMEQNLKLTSIEGKEFEDATKYRQLVGSLNYLTTTKPDISFAVGILSRSEKQRGIHSNVQNIMGKKGKAPSFEGKEMMPLYKDTTCNRDATVTTWESMHSLLEEENPRVMEVTTTDYSRRSSEASITELTC